MAIKHNKTFIKSKKTSRTKKINKCGGKIGGSKPRKYTLESVLPETNNNQPNKSKIIAGSKLVKFFHKFTSQGKAEIALEKKKKRIEDKKTMRKNLHKK